MELVLRNRLRCAGGGISPQGHLNRRDMIVETKRQLAPVLLDRLNDTYFFVRTECADLFRELFQVRVQDDGGCVRREYPPGFPARFGDWDKADWHTRVQKQQEWQAWWAEHGQEALRWAHRPQ
ncbi:MAG: hypothetical protein ACYTBJ_12360 [Planctomycetota bacterium]